MTSPSTEDIALPRNRGLEILAEGLEPFMVRPAATLRDVMAVIDANSEGMALVVDTRERLIGMTTDGDIRRALLRGIGLERPVTDILAQKQGTDYATPITASPPFDRARLLQLMEAHRVRQVPIVGNDDTLLGVALYSRVLTARENLPIEAVIMAGGFGTRLKPLTDDTPKPMLPVAGRPIIEHIVAKLEETGIRHCHITTHYLPEQIERHLGDGRQFGLDISYIHETAPSGTAGALRHIRHSGTAPLLVINGDILTHTDFQAMYRFHQENEAAFTVGVRTYEFQIPYGVLQMDGANVTSLVEKPSTRLFINAGVYLMQPEVLERIPADQRFDMTDLIRALIEAGRKVVSFPIFEYWIDVGRPEDYARAQGEYVKDREHG